MAPRVCTPDEFRRDLTDEDREQSARLRWMIAKRLGVDPERIAGETDSVPRRPPEAAKRNMISARHVCVVAGVNADAVLPDGRTVEKAIDALVLAEVGGSTPPAAA